MSTARTPPRFVPTLTTVLDVAPETGAMPDAHAVAARGETFSESTLDDENAAVEEELMRRVLERVDRSLEDQISDVVAAEVQAQLDVLVPRLRTEIEKVLRRLVNDALTRERAAIPGSTLA